MKTHYLLLFLLLATSGLRAQLGFPRNNAYWKIQVQDYPSGIRQYYSKEDTTISDLSYTKVYVWHSYVPDTALHYLGAYRIEEEKVYFLAKDAIREFLLYDFSLQVGDTLPNNQDFNRKISITKVDTIFYFGRYRKRQVFKLTFNMGYIIEGIGSYSGPFETRYYDALDSQFRLKCFDENHDPTSKMSTCEPLPLGLLSEEKTDNHIQIFPNPSSGLFTLTYSGAKPTGAKVYNSHGNLCDETTVLGLTQTIDLHTQPKGIYYLHTSEGIATKLVVE